jgi:hypothetical protein
MTSSAVSSQNSCPSFFSCHAIEWRSRSATKSRGVYRANAERQKSGFCERKFADEALMLVKLQRPPPEMRIFSPSLS